VSWLPRDEFELPRKTDLNSMSVRQNKLRTGDWVEVKSVSEVAQTLGAAGTLDGMPFMPEMLDFCGRRFRVLRRCEKSCVELAGGKYEIREFAIDDVVLLEISRCSGSDHGGCQRACVLFWKEQWLRKIDATDEASLAVDNSGIEELRAKLKTMTDAEHYFCQSTQLVKTTRTLTRSRIIRNCIADVRSGSRGILEMAGMVFKPLWRKVTAWYPRPTLTGTLKRTPIVSLELRAGELVELKKESEIRQTLDTKGCNRGLLFAHGPWSASSGVYEVQNRLERMIVEGTGEMKTMQNTVILRDLNCTCENVLGGCPRQDVVMWREIWLKRAGESQSAFSEHEEVNAVR
jgi:hypothetical protein